MRLALAALLLASAPALGQASPDTLRQADLGAGVVVTASRLPDALRQTGRHVIVLTAQDIAASPAQGLDELLRFAGGVQTTSRGALGAQSDFALRGAPFTGVLFLVDGDRFNDPQTGHFLSNFPIPLAEISRIEILRGPAAAVYGPDALGGVVHVITRTGSAQGLSQRPRGGSAEATGGADRTGRLALGAWDANRARRWSAGVEAQTTDGELVRDGAGAPIVGSLGEVRTDFRRLAGTAALAQTLGGPFAGARLYVRAAADARDFGSFQFYTPFASDTARSASEMAWAQARLEGQAGGTAWRLSLAGRQHASRYAYNPVTPANDHTNRRAGLTADASRALAPGLTLSGGLSAETRSIDSNNLGAHDDLAGGVFALARWAPTPRLTLTASARLDVDRGFGVEPTPALALAYTAAPALTLRASGGRAVRAPTYVERYINTVNPRAGGNVGNPDLRAERAWNAEAGADLYPAPGLALRATGFWRQTTDLVDFARLTPHAPFFLAQNVLDARALGLELDAAARRALAPGLALRADLSYAYTHIELGGAVPGAVYKYALSHAPHLAQARLGLDAGRTRLGLEGLWKERLALPAVRVANARVGYALGRGLEARAEVRNLADARYSEVFGAPMPGRTWLASLRLDW